MTFVSPNVNTIISTNCSRKRINRFSLSKPFTISFKLLLFLLKPLPQLAPDNINSTSFGKNGFELRSAKCISSKSLLAVVIFMAQSLKPFSSKRQIILPTKPSWTPSGFTAIKSSGKVEFDQRGGRLEPKVERFHHQLWIGLPLGLPFNLFFLSYSNRIYMYVVQACSRKSSYWGRSIDTRY